MNPGVDVPYRSDDYTIYVQVGEGFWLGLLKTDSELFVKNTMRFSDINRAD